MKLRDLFQKPNKFPSSIHDQIKSLLDAKKYPHIPYSLLINLTLETHLTVTQFMFLESVLFRQRRVVLPLNYDDFLDGITIPSTVFLGLEDLFNYIIASKIGMPIKITIINELYLRYAQKCYSITDFLILFHIWKLLPPNMNVMASFQYIFSKLVKKLSYDVWVQPVFIFISETIIKNFDSKINLTLVKFIAKQFSSYGNLTTIQTIISTQMHLFLYNNSNIDKNNLESIWYWITSLDEESVLLPEHTLEFWIYLNSRLSAKRILLPNYFLLNKQRFNNFFPQLVTNIPVKKILKQIPAVKYKFFEFCEDDELHFDTTIVILYLTLEVDVPLKNRWNTLLNIWIKEETQLQNQIFHWQNVTSAYRGLSKSVRRRLLSETGNFFRNLTFQRIYYIPQFQTQIIQLIMAPLISIEPDSSLRLHGLKIVFKHFRDNTSLIPFFIPTWRKFYDENYHVPQLQMYMTNILRDIWFKVLDNFRLNPHALRVWIAELFRFQELQIRFSHELIQQLCAWVSDTRITTIEKYEFLNYLQTLTLSNFIRPKIEDLYQHIEFSGLKLRILPEISTNNHNNYLGDHGVVLHISDKEQELSLSNSMSSLQIQHFSTIRCVACRRELTSELESVVCTICKISYCLECSMEWKKNALYCLNIFPLHKFNSK